MAMAARTAPQRERAAGLASGRVRLDYLTSACPRWCSLLAIAGQSESQAGEHLSHSDAVCAQSESWMLDDSPRSIQPSPSDGNSMRHGPANLDVTHVAKDLCDPPGPVFLRWSRRLACW